jgi:hypothetical protein
MFEDLADRYTAKERKLALDLVTAIGHQERRPSATCCALCVDSICTTHYSQGSFLDHEQRSNVGRWR